MKTITMIMGTQLAFAGCFSSDGVAPQPDADLTEPPAPKIQFESDGSDSVIEVDASDETQWVYLDLPNNKEVWGADDGEVHTPPANWSLAFRRFHINTNGGVNGEGGAEGRHVENDYSNVLFAASLGYRSDAEDGDDEGNDPDTVFLGDGGWYDYNPQTHVLTPKARIYIVRDYSGDYYKIQIEGYYNEAGSSANWTIRYRQIPGPGEPVQLPSDGDSFLYVDAQAGVVAPAEPASDDTWDFAIQRTLMSTNSGTSGSGGGGAKILGDAIDFDTVTETTAADFTVDEMLEIPGPPPTQMYSGNAVLGDWYNYDPQTHVVSPKDRVFAVRGATGQAYKLQVTSWDDGKQTIKFAPIETK